MQYAQFLEWFKPSASRRPLVMGILNVTPDSFYASNLSDAYEHAQHMLQNGVDIIDIGGESTRPEAQPLSLDEELARVIPVIDKVRQSSSVCISVDTYKPEVMQAALNSGANIINDIYALQKVSDLSWLQSLDVPIILMHMQGNPLTMQQQPQYSDGVIAAINNFFAKCIARCLAAGIAKERLILDPGFGFGKTVAHNLEILQNIAQFKQHDLPLALGVSRKSTIGKILDKPVQERLIGSVVASCHAVSQGINIVRTHDVAETKQALCMLEALEVEKEIDEY